jgi:lysophospholipase L1-like esterase
VKKLIFIGDSLTEFFDWQRRFPRYEAINLGIAGERIEELLGRIDEICASVVRPDCIFLMTGINNIAMEEYDIIGAYRELLGQITRCFGHAVVVVQSVLPVRLPWVENEKIKEINVSLQEISRESHSFFLDLYSVFTTPVDAAAKEYLLDDGVHLSAKGYEIWSAAIEQFLTQSISG